MLTLIETALLLFRIIIMNILYVNILRGVIFSVAILLTSGLSYSKDIISRTYLAGGQVKQVSEAIEMANELTFELIDENYVGKWDVFYLGYDGEYHSIFDAKDSPKRPETECHTFNFMRFCNFRYEMDIPSDAAKIYTDDKAPLSYFIKVTCELSSSNNDVNEFDSIFLRLGLPSKKPEKPEILGMKYENIIYDWELDCMLDSEFYVDLRCEDAAVCSIMSNCRSCFENSEDVFLDIIETIHLDCNYNAHYRFEGADWGTIMEFYGYNELGVGEPSDRYFTTDYIDDPEVLARIEEMKNIKNGLQDIKQVKIPISESISINEGYIYCTGEVSSLELFDLNGSLLETQYGAGLIRTDHLPHGVYIINYTESNGRIIHRKVSLN